MITELVRVPSPKNRTPRINVPSVTPVWPGTDWYERAVRPQVEAGNQGRIVALDVDRGAFELADRSLILGPAAERPSDVTVVVGA